MSGKTGEKSPAVPIKTADRNRAREQELVMKVSKEIVVKFVEMGKVTPASFKDVFLMVHGTVRDAMDNDG